MPNRFIKESICASEDLNKLSPMAEILFYRLIVNADDYGAYYGNASIVKSNCFPLRSDDIKCSQVEAWLYELQDAGLIVRYTAGDGRQYLQFVKWEKHQQIRAKNRKFPALDSTCYQMLSNDSKCSRISNTNTNTNTQVGKEEERIDIEELKDIEENGESIDLIDDIDGENFPVEDVKTERGEGKKKEKPPGIFEIFCGEDAELLKALRDFEKMRIKIKKPMTDRAKELLISKLQTFPCAEWVEIVNQSVLNCWAGIYTLKTEEDAPAVKRREKKVTTFMDV